MTTTENDQPIFLMDCLSPSRDNDEEPPTKLFDHAESSPKCATLLAFDTLAIEHYDYEDTVSPSASYDFRPIQQQLKERLEQQKRLDRLCSTPSRAIIEDDDDEDELRIKSCPTSPSFMSRVYTSLTVPEAPQCTEPQLTPRLDTFYADEYHTATSFFCQDTDTKLLLARIGTDYSEESDEEDDIHGISWIPPVRCIREDISSVLLTPRQMHQIARHVLPKGIASCQWKRLYSLVRDGDSLDVCLHYANKDSRTLLVVRTTRGAVFGGFAGDVWAPNGDGYYGKSESCLFTFEQSAQPQSPPQIQKKSLLDEENYEATLPPIRVYRYTGVNRYIQYCDAGKKRMAFGGGGEDGNFGLCVEQEFQQGSTGHCDTFDNEPLCDQENFKIVDVELWGFRSMF